MKLLDLVLKKQWYEMIKRGEKHEEYREIKPYWTKRLEDKNGNIKKYTHVRFRCGYTKQFIMYRITGIEKGKGKNEWGAENNKEYYIIKLANKNIKKEFGDIFQNVISFNQLKYYINGKIDIGKLTELFSEGIRELFDDNTLEFTSNDGMKNYILEGNDEKSKKFVKMISEHE